MAEVEGEWDLAPNSAEAHDEAGVRAAMETLRRYDDGGAATIDEAAIQDDLQNGNPFDPSRALEQINTQYWAVTSPHGLEARSTWGVTGDPDLAAPSEQGDTGGQILRRLADPQEEENLNQQCDTEARNNRGINQGESAYDPLMRGRPVEEPGLTKRQSGELQGASRPFFVAERDLDDAPSAR